MGARLQQLGIDLFSEFPVCLLNLVGGAGSSYFCTVKKNHSRRREKLCFVFC